MPTTLKGWIQSTGNNGFKAEFKFWGVTYKATGNFSPAIAQSWSVPKASLSIIMMGEGGLELDSGEELETGTAIDFKGTIGQSDMDIRGDTKSAHVTGALAPPGLPQQYNVTGNLTMSVILDDPKGEKSTSGDNVLRK